MRRLDYIIFVLFIFMLISKGTNVYAEDEKNILVIHTYHAGLSMTTQYDEEIKASMLHTKNNVEDVFFEYLDVLRIDYDNDYNEFAIYLNNKYKTVNIDGIICVGEDAYNFMNTYHEELFKEKPIVFMGVDYERMLPSTSSQIVGEPYIIPFQSFFENMQKLNPSIEKIHIYTNSKMMEEQYQGTLDELAATYGVSYEIHDEMEAGKYLGEIITMEKGNGVILLSTLTDSEGIIYTLDYMMDQIDQFAKVPVMTRESYYVGKGAVSASYYDYKSYVRNSILRLNNLVEGIETDIEEPAREIKSMFDYAKIKKLNLRRDLLGKDDLVINKPSVVEMIKDNFAAFIMMLLAIISAVLVFAVINLLMRLSAERDREEARKDLQESYQELEDAHVQLLSSQNELAYQLNTLKSKEDELRKSRERYRLAAKGSEFGIWDFDVETGELYFSNKAKEILDLEPFQTLFKVRDIFQFFERDQEQKFNQVIDEHLSMKRSAIEYILPIHINNRKEWISIRGKAHFNELGLATRLAGSLSCITAEKEAGEKLIKIAYTDELTGLNNKAYLNEQLEELCHSSDCINAALMIMDLDHFKTINDSLGHSYGDEVLRKIGSILKEMVGENSEIIRFSGDEFIILITNYGDISLLDHFAERLLAQFRKRFDIDGIGFSNTLSIGISVYPNDSSDMSLLLKHADLALNEAKAKGRNQYVYYSQHIEEVMNHRLWYERALEKAIRESEFELYYQPKYNIEEDRICGFEALIRWHHPEKGLIQPDEFIPIAEESGLIIKIGEWVVSEAIRQLDEWFSQGYTDLSMSVNLSAKQFKEVNLQDVVKRAIQGTQVRAENIEFEITETTALHDLKSAVKILEELRELGYRFALDDFGTGYSSLNYLNVLPIDTLKIDKSFIGKSIGTDTGTQIVKTVIQLAHIYNLDIVAEGVENSSQMTMLQEEKCDMIQGYFISKPVRAEEAIRLLEQSFNMISNPMT